MESHGAGKVHPEGRMENANQKELSLRSASIRGRGSFRAQTSSRTPADAAVTAAHAKSVTANAEGRSPAPVTCTDSRSEAAPPNADQKDSRMEKNSSGIECLSAGEMTGVWNLRPGKCLTASGRTRSDTAREHLFQEHRA